MVDEKCLLRIKLLFDVELMLPQDVQDWADASIINEENNELALGICFCKSEQEMKKYLNSFYYEDIYLDEDVIHSILKQYIKEKLPNTLNDQVSYHFSNLFWIVNKLDESSLRENLYFHDDQLDLATFGYLDISLEDAYQEFYKFFTDWAFKPLK